MALICLIINEDKNHVRSAMQFAINTSICNKHSRRTFLPRYPGKTNETRNCSSFCLNDKTILTPTCMQMQIPNLKQPSRSFKLEN